MPDGTLYAISPAATYHSSDWSELPQPAYTTNTLVSFQLHQHPLQPDAVNMKMEAECSSIV